MTSMKTYSITIYRPANHRHRDVQPLVCEYMRTHACAGGVMTFLRDIRVRVPDFQVFTYTQLCNIVLYYLRRRRVD